MLSTHYDLLRDCLVDTYSDLSHVSYGAPRLEQRRFPYAFVRLSGVPMDWAGVRLVEHTYTYDIVLRWSIPDDPDFIAEEFKVVMANLLIGRVLDGTFANGLSPIVVNVQFSESDDPAEPYLEIVVTLSLTDYAVV